MTSNPGALSRFRVLELGSTIAGPFCGRLLADFGAEVIKVEDTSGDTLRYFGDSYHGKSLYAASLFRNKLTIAIDLRKPEGRDVVKALLKTCDVLVENFRPGTLEKWGFGKEALAALNERLVVVRISGFGQTGPYSQRPGYGVIGEAISGLRYINGDPDRPPTRMATALTDYITGLYGAFGAVMALLHCQLTGRGQHVDAALSECAFSFMEPYVPAFDKLGKVAERAGSRLPGATPNNLYATNDQRFIHITAFSDPIFRRLSGAMGKPALATDTRFSTLAARNGHVAELDAIIAEWAATKDLGEIEALLLKAEVPAARVFSIADIFQDQHYRDRGMLVATADDDLGSINLAAPVPQLSETPGHLRHTGRRLGQDTRAVLSTYAGFSTQEIDALVTKGIVVCDDKAAALRLRGAEREFAK